jgi:hypothetical protein
VDRPVRVRLRRRIHNLADDALDHAAVTSSLTVRTDTGDGDGLLLLVQPEVSAARLLHPLTTRLTSRLADDNQQAPATERLRLRVVLHAGIPQDPYGHAGDDLNHACRLLDAEATRAVLADSVTAVAVVVVSDELYQRVVRAYEGIDPEAWQPIRVHAKETSTRAWVHLPRLATQPVLPTVLALLAGTSRASSLSRSSRRELDAMSSMKMSSMKATVRFQ